MSRERAGEWRLPAEWEPHRAVWVAWPHNRDTWPGIFDRIPEAFARLIALSRRSEEVRVLVPDEETGAALLERRDLGGGFAVEPVVIPTDDAWVRDYAPIFVEDREGRISARSFRFNAWGGKYPPWERDAAAGLRMAAWARLEAEPVDMVLEGGSIDVNGRGLLLTTDSCLLRGGRNPHLEREEIEAELGRLGARRVIWLGGELEGDDTDGHVDNLARFAGERTVVAAVEEDPRDPHHQPLEENLRRLELARDEEGRPLRVVRLPMPEPVIFGGRRLPASYANFLILNGAVIVPQFGGPRDRTAIEVLAGVFRPREVVGLPSRDLVVGQGAVHCLTMQEPRPRG